MKKKNTVNKKIKKQPTKKQKIPSLRASESATWVNCPGSTHIKTGKYPFDNNDNGVFGNAVHNTAAAILKGEKPVLTVQEELFKNERAEDFENFLNFYLEAIESFSWKNTYPGGVEIIEDYMEVDLGTHKITGHADYIYYKIENVNIHEIILYVQIIDLKTGFIPVTIYDNLQLFTYAHLVLSTILDKDLSWNILGKVIKDIEIESIIVQPAHNTTKFGEIVFSPERFQNMYDPNDKTLKTGSWCKYCEKANICPEMKKVFEEYYKPEYQGVTLDRIELIEKVLPYAATVEKVAKRIQSDAKSILLDGGTIKGFKIVKSGKGTKRAWNSNLTPDEIRKKVKLKKSEAYTESLKSPAQIEATCKVLKKDINLDDLTFKPVNDVMIEDNESGFSDRTSEVKK